MGHQAGATQSPRTAGGSCLLPSIWHLRRLRGALAYPTCLALGVPVMHCPLARDDVHELCGVSKGSLAV